MKRRESRDLFPAVVFLLPNIVGVLVFVIFPVIFSLYMSFTNWDIRYHNPFRNEGVRWIGTAQYSELFQDPDMWRFFGNTLFLMLGIPPAIIGSLLLAILLQKLSRERERNTRSSKLSLVLTGAVTGIALVLGALVLGVPSTSLFMAFLIGAILFLGTILGDRLYVALFYLPNFTAGVATFVLWKKLYHPQTGPINAALNPLLQNLSENVNALPPVMFYIAGLASFGAIIGLTFYGIYTILSAFTSGEVDRLGFAGFCCLVFILPVYMIWLSSFHFLAIAGLAISIVFLLLACARAFFYERRLFQSNEANGSYLLYGFLIMGVQWVLLGIGISLYKLPSWSLNGLYAPNWLTDYHWAKPSLILMGVWMTIGSSNMILYLAGLTTIDRQLYEAAEVDGAGGLTSFWHITMPHLAPVTFFIVIMSLIAGLQGGFEMARTMTYGGPAGSTTTLSYYLYSTGFEQGRFGYASAIAWVLFALLFAATLVIMKTRGDHGNG